jgi:hypothetical protein
MAEAAHEAVWRLLFNLSGSRSKPLFLATFALQEFGLSAHIRLSQHFLNFLPLPQGQGSLRPILGRSRLNGSAQEPKGTPPLIFPITSSMLIVDSSVLSNSSSTTSGLKPSSLGIFGFLRLPPYCAPDNCTSSCAKVISVENQAVIALPSIMLLSSSYADQEA